MRAKALFLAAVLLTTGCAPLTPVPDPRERLSATSHAEAVPPLSQRLGQEHGRDLESQPSVRAGPREPERPHRRLGSHKPLAQTRADTGAGAVRVVPQDAEPTRKAVLQAVNEAQGSMSALSRGLSTLATRKTGLGKANGVFTRYVDLGSHQLRWLQGALGSATALAEVAAGVADADMELGILRMTGPRLQAAMFGAMLLAAWVDFLTLADAVLQHCPFYSVERLFMDLHRVQRLVEPTFAALASQDSAQVEPAVGAMPERMEQLTREFHSIREGARVATGRGGQFMAAAQLVEMLTLVSTLKLSLPRLPPAAPATLGVGLVMGSGGVIMGSRLVVSAEWVEMIRRLVKAGVLSIPAASAAVRIHAGGAMMAQANGDLPKGVRDALGDSPEVRAMHETNRAGAGMSDAPKHHVLPQEHRAWFEKRGFTGDMSIDQFCVRLEAANHQALHGGGNWRLGRGWAGEWNQLIMRVLRGAELATGRPLTRTEILNIVAENMKEYRVPMNFVSGRGR
ncbi:DUF2380 domain-containing protein [Pyxidicoccus sp. 3LFB2]